MRLYDNADEFDSKGNKVPNSSRKESGAKEVREARKDWDGKSPLTVSWEIDDGRETVTKTFYPPFTKVNREEDYRIAYEEFQRRFKDEKKGAKK